MEPSQLVGGSLSESKELNKAHLLGVRGRGFGRVDSTILFFFTKTEVLWEAVAQYVEWVDW